MHPKVIGLTHENDLAFIDHLAPLCSLLDIPFVVIGGHHLSWTYPSVRINTLHAYQASKWIDQNADVMITCWRRKFIDYFLHFPEKPKRSLKKIWLPHGHSDKRENANTSLKYLKEEDYILLYGEMMDQLFESIGGYHSNTKKEILGNYRHMYYEENKEEIDSLVLKDDMLSSQPTVLYAPSWTQDIDKTTKDLDAILSCIQNVKSCMVWVKLHPKVIHYLEHKSHILEIKYASSRVKFVHDTTHVYPLLSHADVVISDISSISYDAIALGKPLILLQTKDKVDTVSDNHPLCQSSFIIRSFNNELIEKAINDALSNEHFYAANQKELAQKTFGLAESRVAFKRRISRFTTQVFQDGPLQAPLFPKV